MLIIALIIITDSIYYKCIIFHEGNELHNVSVSGEIKITDFGLSKVPLPIIHKDENYEYA